MSIIFKKIRWKNFLSTGNIFTELDLNSNNTTLIVGDNGAGKSTLLDALSYGLFGKPFRKINKPQLLNTITNKQLVVEVEFTIGQFEYKIVRGIKPNIFQVFQNDKLLNQSSESKDYQEILERQIIKVNHKSFCQVIVLGSASFQPFMQLSAYQRREIIEDLLDLQIFTTMNTLLKNKLLINSEGITSFSSEKKLLEEKLTLVREHLKELQNNNHKLIEEKKSRIVETNEQIQKLNDEYWVYENKRKLLEESAEDEQSIKKKSQKLQELKHKIEANLGILNKEVGFFHKYDNCPTCKQQIDEQFKSETITTKEKEIQEINDGLEKLSNEYDKVSNRISELLDVRSQINDQRMEINRVKTKISSLIEYRETLEQEVNNIGKNSVINDDVKIPEMEKKLKETEKKYYDLIEERNILSVASALLKDGGIKAKIIRQYIPVINKLINKYLSSMEFMCQFELDEEFNETIKSRYRDVFSYASFSEGEKMRINLAILFTWRAIAKLRNSINTNILIMDEVFDSSLDTNGTEEFLKILNSLTSDTNTFIISHKTDQLYEKFEKVIRFEKHKNFSRIA
jgi:DNA repair exonuclease SbcCD ATPase subunit